MNKKINIDDAFFRASVEAGVPLEEFTREIELALCEAMNCAKITNEKLWDEIPRNGEMPSPKEVAAFIIERIGIGDGFIS